MVFWLCTRKGSKRIQDKYRCSEREIYDEPEPDDSSRYWAISRTDQRWGERKKERKKNCKGKTAGENNRFATFCPLAHLRIMETMLEHNVLVIYSL
jgi:hypothetical protein